MTGEGERTDGISPAVEEMGLVDGPGRMGSGSEISSHDPVFKCKLCGKKSRFGRLRRSEPFSCPGCGATSFEIAAQ